MPPNLRSGFEVYRESASEEPGNISTVMPRSNAALDDAKVRMAQRVESPDGKPEEWFDNFEELAGELKKLLAPITIRKVEWQPIGVSVRRKLKGEGGHNLLRSNELQFSAAIDPDCHICGASSDRNLTIEHTPFGRHMGDYTTQLGHLCMMLPSPDNQEWSDRKHPILLPPPEAVSELNLEYHPTTGKFVDASREPIIVCDGSPENYYEDVVSDLMLMMSDAFSELCEAHDVRFFAFSERSRGVANGGYNNLCSRYWELDAKGDIIAHYSNYGEAEPAAVPTYCQSCPLCTGMSVDVAAIEVDDPLTLGLLDFIEGDES